MAKPKQKLIKVCSGKFDFENDRCGISYVTPFLFKRKMVLKVLECLEDREWNKFQPMMCHPKIRKLLKAYNKDKFGATNPFKSLEKHGNSY